MQNQDPTLDPANRELAQALERLRLAPTQTSQRDIWYRAGMEAARKRTRAWQAAAAFMALAAGAIAFHGKPAPGTATERVIYVQRERQSPMNAVYSPETPQYPSISSANLRLRNAVLQNGLDALPISEGAMDRLPPLRPGMSLPGPGKDAI